MRVLLVKDTLYSLNEISKFFGGIATDIYPTQVGEEALEKAVSKSFDVIITGMQLTDMAGVEFIANVRLAGVKTPILVVSNESRVKRQVDALELGADGYLQEPLHPELLVAHTKALIRRAKQYTSDHVMHIGRMTIDTRSKQVLVDHKYVDLTAYEYTLIEHLARHQGQIISIEDLTEHVCGKSTVKCASNNINVFVCRVRKKINAVSSEDDYIHTIRGKGYTLHEPGTVAA